MVNVLLNAIRDFGSTIKSCLKLGIFNHHGRFGKDWWSSCVQGDLLSPLKRDNVNLQHACGQRRPLWLGPLCKHSSWMSDYNIAVQLTAVTLLDETSTYSENLFFLSYSHFASLAKQRKVEFMWWCFISLGVSYSLLQSGLRVADEISMCLNVISKYLNNFHSESTPPWQSQEKLNIIKLHEFGILCRCVAIDCIILQGVPVIVSTPFLSVVMDSDILKWKQIQTSFMVKSQWPNCCIERAQTKTFISLTIMCEKSYENTKNYISHQF